MSNKFFRCVIGLFLTFVMTVLVIPMSFSVSAEERKILDITADDPIKGIKLGNCIKAYDKSDSFCRKKLAGMANGAKLVKAYDLIYESLGSMAESVSFDGLGLTKDQIKTVFNAYFEDSPEHFWVMNKYSIYTVTSTGLASKLVPSYIGNRVSNETRTAELDKIFAEYLTYISGTTDYEKALAAHDLMCERISFMEGDDDTHTAYGALTKGRAACEGYTRAYQALLNILGLENTIVFGTGHGGDHAWNKVNIDGTWVNVDVTWDAAGDEPFRYYFACSDEHIAKDHVTEAMSFTVPDCSSEKLYGFKASERFDVLDVDKITALLAKNNSGGNYSCEFVYTGTESFSAWMSANGRAILQKLDLHGSYSFSYNMIEKEIHFTVSNHGHQFGSWTVTSAATCDKEGTMTRTCSVCGAKQTRAISVKEHTFGNVTLDPGKYFTRKCSICGTVEKYDGISGTAGFETDWTLSADGTLRITGNGAIPSYKSASDAPWYAYRSFITTVEIKSGLTSVGANAFGGCTAIKKVNFFGTADEWKKITVETGNVPFTSASLQYSDASSAGPETTPEPSSPEKRSSSVQTERRTVSGIGSCAYVTGRDVSTDGLIPQLGKKVTLTSPKGKNLTGDDAVGTGSTARVTSDNGKTEELVIIIRGDADGNGIIDSSDARLAVKAAAGCIILKPVYAKAADFDGNGEIDFADIRSIIRLSAGLGVSK